MDSFGNYELEYEQKIDLKDMLFYILYRWRSLLLIAVLLCVLTGGYANYYNKMILPKKGLEIQKQLEEMQSQGQITEEKQNKIQLLQREIDRLKELNQGQFFLLGFMGGVFTLAVCYGVIYVCSDKLRGERELRERYGYYLLGTIPKSERKGLLKGIDRFLERVEGISERISQEEAYWIISTNIVNLANTGGTFLVTGTVALEKLQEFTNIIATQMENVTLIAEANMNATASTLVTLAECDAVILVEQRDKSLRAKVQKETESIAALEKPVVGYVML